MARPRKSIELHRLHGTTPQWKLAPAAGATDGAPSSSTLVAGRPRIPSHLTQGARTEFKRIVQLLERRGTITPGDEAVLATLAEIISRWVRAKAEVEEEGYLLTVVATDSNGHPHTTKKLNPLLRVVENCEGRMLNLLKSLGLTPDMREKITPAKQTETKADPNALEQPPDWLLN